MNNFLKTAFVAAGVVGTVGAVSTAEAANFNVVVDKITMYTDQNDVTSGVTVYDPVNSIGESATRTIDLFNATAKLGTSLSLATPPAGTYETILLEISEIEVSGTSAALDIKAALAAANIGTVSGGNLILPLGTIVTGEALDAAYLGALDTTVIPAPATTVSGLGFTLPKLNLALDESTVDDSATTAAGLLGSMPEVSTVKTSTTDNADLPNWTILVDYDTAFPAGNAASFVSGTTDLKVGLFTDNIPARPLDVVTLETEATAATKTVEFIDVDTNMAAAVPLAWVDSNSNDKLDAGEYFTTGGTLPGPVTGLDVNVAGLAGIATASAIPAASTSAIDQVAIKFGPRTQTLTVAMPALDVSAADDNAWVGFSAVQATGLVSATAGNGAVAIGSADATLTFVIDANPSVGGANDVSRVVELAAAIGNDATDADSEVDATEDAYFGLATSATVDSTTNFSLTTDTGLLSIINIPLDIDELTDGQNLGTYAVEVRRTFSDAGSVALDLFSATSTVNADGALGVTAAGATSITSAGDNL